MATNNEIKTAFVELNNAKDAFEAAILKFKTVYDPSDVGLDEWIESNDSTMNELNDELDDKFEDEDED